MLTLGDIRILESMFEAQKEVFYTKNEIDEKFNRVFDMLDKFLKPLSKAEEDMIIMRYRMDKAEEWIGRASPNLNLDFKH